MKPRRKIMKKISKKRTTAYLLDAVVSGVVTAGVEHLLRKKIKNEAFHALLTPTVVMWTLEYAQLRKSGQTLGYKTMGLKLNSTEGTELTSGQIIKRMVYRDTISTFNYIKDRKAFEGEDGKMYPHDRKSNTIVTEVNN